MIREFRRRDAPAMIALLTTQFPEEEALLGTRPETFFRVVRRVQRPDLRLLFAVLRLLRRPVFRLLVAEDAGRLVGTTLLTFPARAVYLSMVVVDPAVRRRGHARALLAEAERIARQLRRRHLVLDVLAANAPARTLYEQRLGYRPLREGGLLARERPAEVGPFPAALPPGVRPFRTEDERPLVAIARREIPAEVQAILPVPDRLFAERRTTDRIFETDSAAWVVDRGGGPEAMAATTYGPGRAAAQLGDPIVAPDADPSAVDALFRTALAWGGARGAARLLAYVPAYNAPARAALGRAGFEEALRTFTLVRPLP